MLTFQVCSLDGTQHNATGPLQFRHPPGYISIYSSCIIMRTIYTSSSLKQTATCADCTSWAQQNGSHP